MLIEFVICVVNILMEAVTHLYTVAFQFPVESLACMVLIGMGCYINKISSDDRIYDLKTNPDNTALFAYIDKGLRKLDTKLTNNFDTLEADMGNIRSKVLAVYHTTKQDTSHALKYDELVHKINALNNKINLVNTMLIDSKTNHVVLSEHESECDSDICEDEEEYETIITALQTMTIEQLKSRTSLKNIGDNPKTKMDWIQYNMCTQARKVLASGELYDVWKYYPQSVIRHFDAHPDEFKREMLKLVDRYNEA